MSAHTLEFTPQEIDEWKLWMDFLRLERGETVALSPCPLNGIRYVSERAGWNVVAPGAFHRAALLRIH